MWIVGQGEIITTVVVVTQWEVMWGAVIGTIIMARSQLVHIVRSRVLHFCIGIVEVKILIQVLSMQQEKLSDVTLIEASQLTYRVLACTKKAVHEMEKGGSRTNLNNLQGVP